MTSVPRRPSRFLVLGASRREASLNMQIGALAAISIETHGGVAEVVSIRDFDTPSFDADAESDVGLPPAAEAFRERLEANDAFVIASPEYNSSMPGVLKNLIDWVSRYRPQPLVCGRCGSHSNTSVPASTPTCSASRRHTAHSTTRGESAT